MNGLLIFGLLALVLVGAFVALVGRRRDYEATGSAEDTLSDEAFRRIEFGDEE